MKNGELPRSTINNKTCLVNFPIDKNKKHLYNCLRLATLTTKHVLSGGGQMDSYKQFVGIPELLNSLGVNLKELQYLLNASHVDGPYVIFDIVKANGAKRPICAPIGSLRAVQRTILRKYLGNQTVHAAAHGFMIGRSIRTNAEQHIGKPLVLSFDIVDFFNTLSYARVYGLFRQLGHCNTYATLLSRLSTYTKTPYQYYNAYVPQGAPTSPALSNIISRRLDRRLSNLGATYTRYADDLTFSFQTANINIITFSERVVAICKEEGFAIQANKSQVMPSTTRQQVTGLLVNNAVGLTRGQKHIYRAMLHAGKLTKAQLNGIRSYIRMIEG